MYQNKKIIHIVATGINGEIGCNNQLLWHLPEDLKYFKSQTIGQVCIAGRKTIQSFPKPLNKRIIVPVGKIQNGCESIQDALGVAYHYANLMNNDSIYIIGGASIYKQTEDIVDQILLTKVIQSYRNADTFYKKPNDFSLTHQSEYKFFNKIEYQFTTWIRNNVR